MKDRHTGHHNNPFDPAALGRPWGDRPSIYLHIEREIDPATGSLSSPFVDLPDEAPLEEGGIRFAAGAMDGIRVHVGSEPDAADVAKIVFTQLTRTVAGRDPKAFNVLRGYLIEHAALDYVDQLNAMLVQSTAETSSDFAALGRHLLKNAADREVVKFAINLVGLCGGVEDHADLLLVGAHDEFTLYAVVAMSHAGGDLRATWEMAKRATAWGRVHCVDRLDHDFDDAEIQRWLLTRGWDNFVMSEYSAGACARRGRLIEALETEPMNDEIINGAAEILAALARGSPGDGMAGYAHSARATERLLDIIAEHTAPRVEWLRLIQDIAKFVARDAASDNPGGWTPEAHKRCADAVVRVCSRPYWRPIIAQWLESHNDFHFSAAANAAHLVGLDAWEHRFKRLVTGHNEWYWVFETTDPLRLDRALRFAESQIDLSALATGYGELSMFSPGYGEHHQQLSWILQALGRWPGGGVVFIQAGLRSPSTNNRSAAIRTLLRWPPEHRAPLLEAAGALQRLEQNTDLKTLLGRILAGEVVPEKDIP